MRPDPIKVDGSLGEGGGQILRTSLALSCITGKPFEIFNIRANRQKPGLRPQHLQCVTAAARITNAKVTGDKVGASRVCFGPQPIQAGDHRFDIGTAGSTSLVLHTIFLPLALADGPSAISITGGTHVPFAPCFHYLQKQWAPYLREAGFDLTLQMKRAGYYPEGGGRIAVKIEPAREVSPLIVDGRGPLIEVEAISTISNLPQHIAERQAARAEKELAEERLPFRTETAELPAHGKGTMLFLEAKFANSRACHFSLGARGKRAEKVAEEACRELRDFLQTDAAVDRFLADQLLLPLSLATGESRFTTERVTQHLLTNAEVIKLFLPAEVRVEGELGEEGTITVRGAGVKER